MSQQQPLLKETVILDALRSELRRLSDFFDSPDEERRKLLGEAILEAQAAERIAIQAAIEQQRLSR